jgi:nucleotide-binding universal stress UspA family protein
MPQEVQRLRNTKASIEDLEQEFIDTLQEKEPAILKKIGLVEEESGQDRKALRKTNSCNSYVDEEAEFRKICVDTVDKIRSKNAMTLMVAVDGSEGSDIAFRTMMRLRKRLDHVCIFHAYSKFQDDCLPEQYLPPAIKTHYESELIATYRVPVSRFAMYWEDRRGRTARDVFTAILNEYRGGVRRGSGSVRPTTPPMGQNTPASRQQPNFFFCGYVGRKGRKQSSSQLGSFTDSALRNCHMPIIICKSLCPAVGRIFVIAVDGSPLCKRGFDLAMTIINPKDTVHVVNVYNPRKTGSGCEPPPEEIEEFYEKELEIIGPVYSKFDTIICQQGSTIAECLVEFSNEVGADFFVLSPRTRPFISPITEYVISNANASIVLVKN